MKHRLWLWFTKKNIKILSTTGVVEDLRTLIHNRFRAKDAVGSKGFESGRFLHKIPVVARYNLDPNTVLIGSKMLAQACRAEFCLFKILLEVWKYALMLAAYTVMSLQSKIGDQREIKCRTKAGNSAYFLFSINVDHLFYIDSASWGTNVANTHFPTIKRRNVCSFKITKHLLCRKRW